MLTLSLCQHNRMAAPGVERIPEYSEAGREQALGAEGQSVTVSFHCEPSYYHKTRHLVIGWSESVNLKDIEGIAWNLAKIL